MKRMTEAADEDGVPRPAAGEDAKPLTDEEMAKAYGELLEARLEQTFQIGETKLESLEVKSNAVSSVTTQSIPSLEVLLTKPYTLWDQSGLVFESLRFEKDAEGRLRVTLTPHSGNMRWTRNAKQMWKASQLNTELRFVLPGKVLTSGLPQTEGSATWIVISAKKEETLTAAAKLYDAPTVITAELGGLTLDTTLDSKALQRQSGRTRGGDSDLPLTDAGPGFASEALNVTVTTLHWFQEGQKHIKNPGSIFGYQPTGVVVQAKVFAPKGRTFQSITGVRVLMAVDDKGRPIMTTKVDEDSPESMAYSAGGGRGQANSMQVQLRLPLPAADAQSIEQLDAEAIAVTVGHWKELIVPSITATTTNEVDLARVLPGAKLTITKVTSTAHETTIQAQIKGPPAIRQIEIQAMTSGRRHSNSRINERGFKSKGAESSRSFTLQAYGISDEGEIVGDLVSMVVRVPEDQKRERVKFSLKGLDLL